MTKKFEDAVRHIICQKKGWCESAMLITSCVPHDTYYELIVYLPSLNRADGSETVKINLTEVLMNLN